ncbi:hypothetical protein RCL1_002721 [Eukaryota sp. TZLM3-RCL]
MINPLFEIPKHSSCLAFLHELCPSHPFSLTISSQDFDFHLPSSICVGSLTLSTLSDDLINGLNKNFNFPTVTELTIIKFNTPSLCSSLSTLFPSLNTLNVVQRGVFVDLFVLPCSLNKLTSLSLQFTHRNSPRCCDVSSLTQLQLLSITGHSKLFVEGVLKLDCLKNLTLNCIENIDGLNKDLRLEQLKLVKLSRVCIERIFRNKISFEGCKIVLQGCSVYDSFEWIVQSNLIGLSRDEFNTPQDHVVDTNCLSSLEQLSLDLGCALSISIELSNCHKLQSASFRRLSQSFTKKLSIKTPLYVRYLNLTECDFPTIINIIKHCEFINYLEIVRIDDNNQISEIPELCLNYLHYLNIDNCRGFFSIIPVLPRLRKLRLRTVSDFNFLNFNTKFPVLHHLILDNCQLSSVLGEDNTSLKTLYIKNLLPGSQFSPLLIQKFVRLYHLTLDLGFRINCSDSIIFPTSLRFLFFNLPFSLLKDSCVSLFNLFVISGRLSVVEEDVEYAQEWLKKLTVSKQLKSFIKIL